MSVSINNRFKSGKYKGLSYIEVWKKDSSYLYWMADNFPFFDPIVKSLENRDLLKKQFQKKNHPSLETVKEFFKQHPICGFDMSEYIGQIYENCPNHEKLDYFNSLKQRNNL